MRRQRILCDDVNWQREESEGKIEREKKEKKKQQKKQKRNGKFGASEKSKAPRCDRL